jgi:hypothetical protein
MSDKIDSSGTERSASTGGFFMITAIARKRIETKRRKKGLGELNPRINAWYK